MARILISSPVEFVRSSRPKGEARSLTAKWFAGHLAALHFDLRLDRGKFGWRNPIVPTPILGSGEL